jgi:hypothetical protein
MRQMIVAAADKQRCLGACQPTAAPTIFLWQAFAEERRGNVLAVLQTRHLRQILCPTKVCIHTRKSGSEEVDAECCQRNADKYTGAGLL